MRKAIFVALCVLGQSAHASAEFTINVLGQRIFAAASARISAVSAALSDSGP